MLIAATVLEKMYGSGFVYTHIYTAPYTIALWISVVTSAIILLIRCRTWKKTATFILHLSFILILGGALVTDVFGIQGKVHLRQDEDPVCEFQLPDGTVSRFPFSVSLKVFLWNTIREPMHRWIMSVR